MHELISKHQPSKLNLQDTNTTILFPTEKNLKQQIWHNLKFLEGELVYLQLNSAQFGACNPDEINSSYLTSMPEGLLMTYHRTRPTQYTRPLPTGEA